MYRQTGTWVVILEGMVEDLVTSPELDARIVDARNAKYGRLTPDRTGDGLWRLRPHSVRAWSSESLEDGTRWNFRS